MKKIAIPHFEQVTDYSCGPACVRMVLGYYGIEADPPFLIQLLGATEDTGTSTDAFSRIAHVYELEYLSQEHATVDTIIHFIENDIPVIANYICQRDEEGHFIVIYGYDDKQFYFSDPTYGQDETITFEKFLPRWRAHFEPGERWMLAIWPASQSTYSSPSGASDDSEYAPGLYAASPK